MPPADDEPALRPAGRRGLGGIGPLPPFTAIRLSSEPPSCTPAASPCLRRRPSTWPPHRRTSPVAESRPPPFSGRAHCTRPRSTRFEPVQVLRGFGRWFLSYGFSSRLPGPYRLAVPVRPVVVRAAYHPPARLRDQAALGFASLLRQTSGGGLSPPPGDSGASWRTSAYLKSILARTASAACRSVSPSTNCSTSTSASRPGDQAGLPRDGVGEQSAQLVPDPDRQAALGKCGLRNPRRLLWNLPRLLRPQRHRNPPPCDNVGPHASTRSWRPTSRPPRIRQRRQGGAGRPRHKQGHHDRAEYGDTARAKRRDVHGLHERVLSRVSQRPHCSAELLGRAESRVDGFAPPPTRPRAPRRSDP